MLQAHIFFFADASNILIAISRAIVQLNPICESEGGWYATFFHTVDLLIDSLSKRRVHEVLFQLFFLRELIDN